MHSSIGHAFDTNAGSCPVEKYRSRRRAFPGPDKVDFGKDQYDKLAAYYATREDIPHSKVEKDLVTVALGDCTGYRILDLVGGSGDHARLAVQAGATHIDVLDISQAMMDLGKDVEVKAGREVLHWHSADVSKPLWQTNPDLPLQGYDLVMAIWPFDHAETLEDYLGVWRNIAVYLKPGGRVVGARVANPWSPSLHTAKYGTKVDLLEQTSTKAVKMQVTVNTDPPFAFESTSTELSLRGDTYVPSKLGIVDIQDLPPIDSDTVKADPEFWKEFIDDPCFVVFTGRKATASV